MSKVYKQLSELGEIITGKTPSTSNNDLWDGDIPFITPTDINGYETFYQFKTERYVSNLGALKQKKTILPPNSVCITCIGSTIGKPCVTKVESITNQQINSIIPNSENDFRYVYYLIRENLPYLQLIGGGSGSGTPIISKNKFAKFKFLVEDNLCTQRRIASILSDYDNLIENNNKRIRLLEQMAENLYKEWFVRFRFPGHENAEFEKGLPKGWKRVKICDVCNVTDGVHNTVIDAPQSKYFLLSSKNIKAGKIVIGDNERTIDEDTFIKLRKRTKMSKGDILLSSVGTIGEVCLLNEEPLYYEFQRSVAIIKPDFSISNSCLLYEMFKVMRNDFVNAAHGAAQQCLFIGDLKKMKICLPSKTISDIFERKVRPIYNMISSISKQNENLSRQRDLLLPRLMSGKLEVKV